jgi:hypothetical protein
MQKSIISSKFGRAAAAPASWALTYAFIAASMQRASVAALPSQMSPPASSRDDWRQQADDAVDIAQHNCPAGIGRCGHELVEPIVVREPTFIEARYCAEDCLKPIDWGALQRAKFEASWNASSSNSATTVSSISRSERKKR